MALGLANNVTVRYSPRDKDGTDHDAKTSNALCMTSTMVTHVYLRQTYATAIAQTTPPKNPKVLESTPRPDVGIYM
jgi:hypothetical protein